MVSSSCSMKTKWLRQADYLISVKALAAVTLLIPRDIVKFTFNVRGRGLKLGDRLLYLEKRLGRTDCVGKQRSCEEGFFKIPPEGLLRGWIKGD